MAKYKLISENNKTTGILKQEDIPTNTKISIPIAPGNIDYEEYLEWVAAGNTAEAAD